MPLTPRQTHKGTPLHSEAKGGGLRETVGEIPPEFRCAIDLSVLEQPVPYDSEIPMLSDTILSTRLEQNFTSESTLKQVTKPPGVVTLLETYTDKYKQSGTRTRNFRPITDLPLIGLPSATRDVNTKNLGNYHFIEDIEDSGTLFTQQVYSVERPDSAPEHFKELLPLISESHLELGIAAMPVLGDSEYKKSEGQQDVYTKKVDRTYRDPIAFPATLSSFKLTPEQQIATGLDTLDDDPLDISESDAETVEASAEDLGDGTWYKHKFDVPAVFHKPSFARERQILGAIPAEFRVGIETINTSSELAGIAALPGTLTGTIEQKSEEQVTVFKKKITQRELSLDPTGTHTDYKMTPEQQLETLDIALTDVAPSPASLSALTVESEIKSLGGSLWLETEGTVPIVFDKHLYAEERDLLGALPAEFRSGIDRVTESFEDDDPVVPPTLIAGQEFESQQRTTMFKRKVEKRFLDFSATGTLPGEELTELYGGGALTTSKQVDDAPLGVSGNYLVTEGRAQAIGGGLYFKELKTRETGPWPELEGQQYDERLDVVLPFVQQVKNAATIVIGTAKTDIEPIDMWRSKARTIDSSAVADVLDAYVFSYPSRINVEMPDLLESVTCIPKESTGEGASSEDGTHAAVGSFSVSQSLRASAQSSVNLSADVQILIKQFWGNNVNCTHYHFFLPQPVTAADVLTKINALVVGSVSDWPKFNPEIVNLTAIGRRASLQVVATSGGSLAASTSGNSSTASGGTGYSRELGLNVQTIRISPTIHGTVNVIDPPSGTPTTITAHADSTSDLSILYEIDQTQDVVAELTPTSIPATTGATTWPASGLFLYRVDAQPYRYGYVQFHAIVVDAADFPYN